MTIPKHASLSKKNATKHPPLKKRTSKSPKSEVAKTEMPKIKSKKLTAQQSLAAKGSVASSNAKGEAAKASKLATGQDVSMKSAIVSLFSIEAMVH